MLLLYTGAVWGIGAFLVMPDLPAPVLVFGFAVVPSLALALILKDTAGVSAFVLPAAGITAAAAVMGAWPFDLWVAAAILASGIAMILLVMLQCATKDRRISGARWPQP